MASTTRIVLGTLLVAIGLAILLDRLEIVHFGELVAIYWPVILLFIGLVQLVTRSSPIVGILLILLGLFFLAKNLDLIPQGWPAFILPGVLILVGIIVLLGPKPRSRPRRKERLRTFPKHDTHNKGRIRRMAVLGGYDTTSRADPFTGGTVTAILGAIDLDLTGARLPHEGATLEATALLGGIDIQVPSDWYVQMQGTPLLGGIDSKALEPRDPDARVLRLDATAIFGAIEIRNPKAPPQDD